MKKFSVQFLFILASFLNNHSVKAEQLITLFLKPYPVISPQADSDKLGKKLHRAGKISNNLSKHYLSPKLSGMFATYGGFLTTSDLNGEISFPRKHVKSFINLIITERLTPIVMASNTIHHWELEEGAPAEAYRMEQKWDPETRLLYWDVTQEPLPKNNIIPLESMVLIADPKYVDVPLGISLFKDSPHLILPDIYIKKGINLTADALYVLNLSHYFGGILPMYKKEKARYLRHLTY
jgi:hypothetical protein